MCSSDLKLYGGTDEGYSNHRRDRAMYEVKEINGRRFEVVRIDSALLTSMIHNHNSFVSIWDAYKNPSNAKECIYNSWKLWQERTERVYGLSVRGHNCFKFTLGALYFDSETDGYRTYMNGYGWINGYIKVTDMHNYLYLAK